MFQVKVFWFNVFYFLFSFATILCLICNLNIKNITSWNNKYIRSFVELWDFYTLVYFSLLTFYSLFCKLNCIFPWMTLFRKIGGWKNLLNGLFQGFFFYIVHLRKQSLVIKLTQNKFYINMILNWNYLEKIMRTILTSLFSSIKIKSIRYLYD